MSFYKDRPAQPDPAALPRAGRIDTFTGEPGQKNHRRKEPAMPPGLHMESSCTKAFAATGALPEVVVSENRSRFVAHDATLTRKPKRAIVEVKNRPLPGNMCGLGRSVGVVHDSAEWTSTKKATMDAGNIAKLPSTAPPSQAEAKRSAWAYDKAQFRGTTAWQSEAKEKVGTTGCWDMKTMGADRRMAAAMRKRAGESSLFRD
jgi:hypothetical protein